MSTVDVFEANLDIKIAFLGGLMTSGFGDKLMFEELIKVDGSLDWIVRDYFEGDNIDFDGLA